MSQSINYKLQIRKIIQTLTQWTKKPTLDHDLSRILDEYQSCVDNGAIQFSDAAMIIQAYTCILEKRIDLLFDDFFSLSMRLCSALRQPEEELKIESNTDIVEKQQQNAIEPVKETLNTKQSKKDEQKQPEKPKRGKKKKTEELADSSKKLSIPGFPDEILESLNLTNCNINEVVRECLAKLTPTHPLYSVFAKIGDEISRTKNLITYNDVSLSGKCWNVLYILENLLKKNNPETVESSGTQENSINLTETSVAIENTSDNIVNSNAAGTEENNNLANEAASTLICTQISENGVENINEMYEDNNNEDVSHNQQDSSVTEAPININSVDGSNTIADTTPNTTESTPNNTEIIPAESSNNESSNNATENIVQTESNSEISNTETSIRKSLSDAEYFKIIKEKCKVQVKDIKINLLRLPDNVLLKVDYFRLSSEFFNEVKKKKAERKIRNLLKAPIVITRKRQGEMEAECRNLVKKLKSFNLNAFEEFCYSYNCSQGICVPIPERIIVPSEKVPAIPEKVCPNRKSLDNRSEMSYGCPVTPDSGRFSMSFHTDSEFEHTDFDIDSDHRRTSSRADSGCCLMSPPHETNMDSTLPFLSEPVPNPEDLTLSKLKKMFPNSFADSQRAEVLKSLVRPPEEQGESDNYLEWKKFIDDKTAKDVEFNIHEYGSEILNSFPTKTKNEKISFKTVVHDKSVGDVCRYFVSALQLANTYNVELCDERQGEVKAEGFNLKFLNDERPHEEFEELNVPSESHFLANLESSPSMRNCNSHSTPSTSNIGNRTPTYKKPIKRRRLDGSLL